MRRTKTPSTKVAVLIPVYNTMDYLEASIDSILAQTYEDLDIIIIDDHSTDGSYEYLLTLTDERIRLYRNDKNLGIDGTLNKGLSLSNAQYIVRHDSDDISYPERIAKQIDFLDNHSTIHVLGTKSMIVRDGKRTGVYPLHQKGLSTFLSCPVHHPTTAYRTDLVYKYDLQYSSVAEDYHFWNHIFYHNNYHRDTFATMDEVLVDYLIRDNQLSQINKNAMIAYKTNHQLHWFEKYLQHHGWNSSLPTEWTIEDYNQFMQKWKEWKKPSGYAHQEYNKFMKCFAWNILFHQTKKNGIYNTLSTYISHGNYDFIGMLRLIKQGIEHGLNIPRRHY